MEAILEKYANSVIKNLEEDNIKKITAFLQTKNCDFIEELFEDYLDLFTIEYETFVEKYEKLNKIYNNKLLDLIKEDMDILEQFFID